MVLPPTMTQHGSCSKLNTQVAHLQLLPQSQLPLPHLWALSSTLQPSCNLFPEEHQHSKRVEALKLLSRLQDVAVIDPQVAFTLLRVCGSLCRLAHIARSTPPSLSSDPLQIFDMAVKECFATCSALELTEHAWLQVQLGLRYGGLGLHSLALHACAAYIAS